MQTSYDIYDFQVDCYAFNEIANKHKLTSLKDIQRQYELILEETLEIKEKGIDQNNVKEVLDGCLDVMVTAFGLMQKLEILGVDMSTAMCDTATNNLSKFPSDAQEATETSIHHMKQGVFVTAEYNTEYEVFVVKNKQDKVMKPASFESNDLSNCIPADLLLNGFESK
jgi:hypothetical protein